MGRMSGEGNLRPPWSDSSGSGSSATALFIIVHVICFSLSFFSLSLTEELLEPKILASPAPAYCLRGRGERGNQFS
jgi:hypothetical protein